MEWTYPFSFGDEKTGFKDEPFDHIKAKLLVPRHFTPPQGIPRQYDVCGFIFGQKRPRGSK